MSTNILPNLEIFESRVMLVLITVFGLKLFMMNRDLIISEKQLSISESLTNFKLICYRYINVFLF